ncbi:hypothetical protein SOVF_084130 [Spinacia oleracea]|nr:hypothetical protein SOVF_084130 [Spinacia oleracea]
MSFKALFPLFFCILLQFSFISNFAGAIQQEAEALVEWKQSLHSLNQSFLSSWSLPRDALTAKNSNVITPCHWLGVGCENGSVTRLNLTNVGLTGTIPPEVGYMISLTELRINLNNLTGPIPPSIGNLRGLKTLSVYGNKLSGSLPKEFDNLTNLTLCFLSNNTLSGSLPEKICQGGILQDFCASNNRFSGTVPKGLKNCTSLTRLRLDRNNFVGNITEDFAAYPVVDYIDLSYNNFEGEISSDWAKCKNMTSLKISDNNITGKIPPELGKATKLHYLDLSSNQLVGEIPKELGNLKSLFNLTLSNNKLSGNIPREVGNLLDLASLDLGANGLNGTIPEEIGNCPKMIYLNLSRNGLNGVIPWQIGSLVSLQVLLDLSRNSLSGEIPLQLGNLDNLEELDLSHNNFSGQIPSTFDQMQSLISVDVSYNNLEGPLPYGKVFMNSPLVSFMENKALCGNITGLIPCPRALNFSKRKGKNAVALITAPILGVGVFVCIVVAVALYLLKGGRGVKGEKNRKVGSQRENMFSIWSFDGKLVYEDIKQATKGFDVKYCIGEGGHGTVYKAVLSTGQIVAVKKLKTIQNPSFENAKNFEAEIEALSKIRHRNIVKLNGFCSHAQHSLLVYEYLERGSLGKLLGIEKEARELDWEKRVIVIKGIANALCYMHYDCSPPIIHRDLSSNNVLLDRDYEPRVSDFGTARLLSLDSCRNIWLHCSW